MFLIPTKAKHFDIARFLTIGNCDELSSEFLSVFDLPGFLIFLGSKNTGHSSKWLSLATCCLITEDDIYAVYNFRVERYWHGFCCYRLYNALELRCVLVTLVK